MGKVKIQEAVKYAGEKDRDLRIVKICATCGSKYHPRRNSYQTTSRFCSQECARKGLRGALY